MGVTETEPTYYDGPVVYVGAGMSGTTADGRELDPGWHYTAVTDEDAKAAAIIGLEAQVALWEKRAALPAFGRFADDQLDAAKKALTDAVAAPFHVPGEKLHLEDSEDGSQSRYRLATDADEQSWHDRKHKSYATFSLEDASDGIRVTEDELGPMKDYLEQLRKGGGQ